MQLTRFQKKAVKYIDQPLLIIAGAGTGKTTVLVEKIKYLIQKKLASPEDILALTFTEKAALEMEERVDKILPLGIVQTHISTFHSFCDQILRDDASHIGLSSSYKLIGQAETVMFIRQNLFAFDLEYFRPLSNPNKFIEALIQHVSRLQDEDVQPKNYISWIKKNKKNQTKEEFEKNIELARAYRRFQDLKIKENSMTFDDLIYYTLKLLRTRNSILEGYRQKFKYLLVDEFQDTNIAQYELIKLLSPNGSRPHLTVIGDDNQSIYKFRGAAISNILQFMNDYKKAEKIVITKNFRSIQPILDLSYRVIKNNDPDTLESRLDISKNLTSMTGKGDKNSINFIFTDRIEQETESVAKEILKLNKTKKYDFSDFAILVRANNHSRAFTQTFSRLGIPYQFLGPGILFKQREVKDLIAYLKVIYNIHDSTAFYRVLTLDILDIDSRDLAIIMAFTYKTRLTLYEAVEAYLSFFYSDISNIEYLNYKKHLFSLKKDSREKLYRLYQNIQRALKRIKKDSAGQILYNFLETTGYLARLMNYKSKEDEKVAINISKFFDRLKSYEAEHEDASIFAVVDYITMSMELGESPRAQDTDWSQYNGVNLLTVHSAKGLEFPVVFMVNLTSGRFPTYARREKLPIPEALIKEILPIGNFHEQEERRLFYVGMTRAKNMLYFTASNFYGEGKRARKISTFVSEALGKEWVENVQNKKQQEKRQLSIFDTDYFRADKKQVKTDLNTNRPIKTTFSYSQIDVYKTCPLKYKYRYILNIPTIPTAVSSFGTTVHVALQEFYLSFRNGKRVNLNKLIQYYNEAWIPLGYSSKPHEERVKREGERLLTQFYKTYFDKDTQIIDLEKWFKIKISNNVFLTGKIDRVDAKKRSKIEIIDYKTGKVPDQKKMQKNLQLAIYTFAASDSGLYKKNPKDVILTLYFLQDNKKFSFTKEARDLRGVKKQVIEVARSINDENYDPRVGPWCDFCPFKINCEAWQ